MDVPIQGALEMKTLRIPLRIVFYKEDGDWIAHCLEFDLIGDGETKKLAIQSLATAIAIQIEQSHEANNPANLISPADPKFSKMYFQGEDVADFDMEIDGSDLVVIERTEAREYSDADSGLVSA